MSEFKSYPNRNDYISYDISFWQPKKEVGFGHSMQSIKEWKELFPKLRMINDNGTYIKRDDSGEVEGISQSYQFVFQADDNEPPLSKEAVSKWFKQIEEYFINQKCIIR